MAKMCPTIFVSHGGGPCFWMDWDPPHLFDGMRKFFEDLPQRFSDRPKAIVVVSAHWEEDQFTIQSTPHPDMIYDDFGFPENTYELKYPASGSPEIAKNISHLLLRHGVSHSFNSNRGYDHGVYVPLLIAFTARCIGSCETGNSVNVHRFKKPLGHFWSTSGN